MGLPPEALMGFWLVVILFTAAQNLQVGIYGLVSRRLGGDLGGMERLALAFRDPWFLAALLGLSAATAGFRLWLFPAAGGGSHPCHYLRSRRALICCLLPAFP